MIDRPKIQGPLLSPAVRISENVLDGILHKRPKEGGMTFLDIGLGTVKQILDEISKDVNGRFSGRKWG